MRRAFAIVSLALLFLVLAGCDTAPTYAPVIVSPAALRNALPEMRGGRPSMVQDEHGQPHRIYGVMKVEYAPEPPVNGVVTNLFAIEDHCFPPTIPHPNCELDKHANAPWVYVENGSTRTPKWDAIGSYTALFLVGGGIVTGEVVCFADCGTGGKIAVASADAVVVTATVVVIVLLVEAFGRHGMN